MKRGFNYIFAFKLVVILSVLFSCRSDDDSIQKIDQIFNLYMKNGSGVDLLNKSNTEAYTSVTMNDIFGATASAPVNYSLKMTSDSINYIEYIAGAKRQTLDSISPEDRWYNSKIQMTLTKTATDIQIDTLEIQYHWTPAVFEVSKVYYNGVLKFEKQPDVPNVVTIVK